MAITIHATGKPPRDSPNIVVNSGANQGPRTPSISAYCLALSVRILRPVSSSSRWNSRDITLINGVFKFGNL